MIIQRLIALLSLRQDPDNDAEERDFTGSLDNIERGIRSAGLAGAAMAAGIATLAAGFGALAVRTASAIDPMGKFAAATDLSFEGIQKLDYANNIFGGNTQSTISALDNLQQKIAEYKRGQGDFRLLGEIGVSVEGVDAIGFVDRLADSFSGMSNQRAQELGRKLGLDRNFIAMLQSGSDGLDELKNTAVKYGLVIGEDAAKASADFNDALYTMQQSFYRISDRVMTGLMPALTASIDKILEFVAANKEAIDSGLTEFVETIFNLMSGMVKAIGFVINSFQFLSNTVGGTNNALLALGGAFLAIKLAGSAAFVALIAMVKELGIVAAITNLKMFFPFVAIVVVVGLVLAAFDDLMVFIKGEGNSVIGSAIEQYKEFEKWLRKTGDTGEWLADTLGTIGNVIATPARLLGNVVGAAATDGNYSGAIRDAFGIAENGSYNAQSYTPNQQEQIGTTLFRSEFTPRNYGNNKSTMQVDVNVKSAGDVEPAITNAIESGARKASNNLNYPNTVTQ